MTTIIHCRHCNGSGREPISDVLQETLGAVTREWATTETVHARLGREAVARTALCNRLVKLKQMGLAENRVRPENRREFEWRRK